MGFEDGTLPTKQTLNKKKHLDTRTEWEGSFVQLQPTQTPLAVTDHNFDPPSRVWAVKVVCPIPMFAFIENSLLDSCSATPCSRALCREEALSLTANPPAFVEFSNVVLTCLPCYRLRMRC